MIEAIGHRQLGTYFATIDRLLAPDGLAGIQAILVPDQRYRAYRRQRDWIRKHIFPGGMLPSLEAITTAARRSSDLMVHDVREIGPHYARTLREWRERFLCAAARSRRSASTCTSSARGSTTSRSARRPSRRTRCATCSWC